MASQLAAIYAALAGITVPITVDGDPLSVAAVGLSDLPQTIDSWRGPVRLLLPVSAGRANGQIAKFHTFKGGASSAGVITVDWTLTDLFFLRPVGAGVGLEDAAPALIDYCAAYMGAIGPLRGSQWSVTAVAFPILGVFTWPEGAGKDYLGVSAQLTIREIV